jgi:UPF0716 protein FxsA
MPFVLLFFILTPILEIFLFVKAGEQIGLWPTLGLVILTAFIGTALLRHQGLAILRKAQDSLNHHRFPVEQVFDGLCLLVAGAFLLTPGFMTDAFGFLLFFPVVRAALARTAQKYMVSSGRVKSSGFEANFSSKHDGPDAPIINGEFQDITPQANDEKDDAADNSSDTPKGLLK